MKDLMKHWSMKKRQSSALQVAWIKYIEINPPYQNGTKTKSAYCHTYVTQYLT